MASPFSFDAAFTAAIKAIDNGDVETLTSLLDANPTLVSTRLDKPEEGYFAHPYLLWFVAGNPIRMEHFPPNITTIATLIIDRIRIHAPESLNEQLNDTLALVSSGRVSRACRVQLPLIDLLLDAGADANSGVAPALPHGELEALTHLIEKGAGMTLEAAIALDRYPDIDRLMPQSDRPTRQTALAVAALYGKAQAIARLLKTDIDINAFNPPGYHSHSTPLHQAALAGSLPSVRLLVEAGARLDIPDTIYHGTPLGWAEHGDQREVAEYLKKYRSAD